MKKIHIESVSATQSGDYFQVDFDNDDDKEEILADDTYFLIQCGFEFEDNENEAKPYIECNDSSYIGHFKIKEAVLSRNRFFIKFIKGNETKALEIDFPDQDIQSFAEVKRILKVIIPEITIQI
jgi:hypothetical protein